MRPGLACLVLAGLALAVAGCVSDAGPDAESCGLPSVHVALALTDDGLEPGTPSVCRDQAVHLSVESEVDGILHIHGYDSEVPAFEVRSGETAEVSFAATRSGQFPVEFHAADDPRGVGVGVFTVHEP
jgi:hypothetical protein